MLERGRKCQYLLGQTSMKCHDSIRVFSTARTLLRTYEVAFASDEIAQINLAQTNLNGLLSQAAIVGAERILWLKYGIAAMVGILLLMARRVFRWRRKSEAEAVVIS